MKKTSLGVAIALTALVSGCSDGEGVAHRLGETQQAIDADAAIVIRQVGVSDGTGCGNVELFNRSQVPASLTGKSLQAITMGGVIALPAVSLEAGQSFLVGVACVAGASGPFDLLGGGTPFYMGSGTSSFNGYADSLALVSDTSPLECSTSSSGGGVCSPTQLARIIDLVGYSNAANFENSRASFLGPGIQRKQSGRQDTNNNSVDFEHAATIKFRNMASFWGVQDAPALDPTHATPFGESTKFIYEGANPVQTGVAAGTIDPEKAGWLVGFVKNEDGTPNADVVVTIADQPKYGQTKTLSNGRFDMIVNGGATFNLRFSKPDHLPADRRLTVGWQQTAALEDLVLMKPDTNATVLTGDSGTWQIAEGSESTTDGARTPVLAMPPNTKAVVEGTNQELSSMTLRLTEYTRGADGLRKMPAPLAQGTGYTYAVEIAVDEAPDAKRVNFTKDVYVYLDNFLEFAVGAAVPSGYYDRSKVAWIAAKSGRVINIWNDNDVVKVDVTPLPDGDDQVLTNHLDLNFTAEELAQLRTQYVPTHGASKVLWRVPINHMTPWDFNWPVVPPAGAGPPPPPSGPTDLCSGCCSASGSGSASSDNTKPGSIIGCDSQSLGEKADVPGTPYSLHYNSSRMPGAAAARQITVPLTGAQVLPELILIKASVAIAGRRHEMDFTPVAPATVFAPNLSWTFTWDGLDIAGRPVVGTQNATVNVTAYYRSQYAPVDSFGGFPSPEALLVARARAIAPFSRRFTVPLLGRIPDQGWSMGGWTLSEHHYYDVPSNRLYLGSGGVRPGATSVPIITRLATGFWTGNAPLGGLGVGPNGDIFVADSGYNRIVRINSAGVQETVAGSNGNGTCSTSPPSPNDNPTDATLARIHTPNAVVVAPDGTLYIAAKQEHTIRKATPLPNGKYSIAKFAGTTCVSGYSGDGGPAVNAKLSDPHGVAIGPDGSVYIADNFVVRRVDPSGIIRTVAGTGGGGQQHDHSGAGKLASTVPIGNPEDVAVLADGTLLIVSGYEIMSVDTNGILRFLSKSADSPTQVIDGVPLTSQSVDLHANAIAVRPDGSFVFNDEDWQKPKPIGSFTRSYIRSVDPSGIVTSIASTPNISGGRDRQAPPKGLALGEGPPYTLSLAAAPNGDVIAFSNGNVYRIEVPKDQAATACDEDSARYYVIAGEELYCFDKEGRHLKTVNARTGAALLSFGYSSGALTSVTDRHGRATSVSKLSSPSRYEITAPYGQKTTVMLGASGSATSIGDGLGQMTLVPLTDGLLDRLNDRNGNLFDFTFDDAGFLTADASALGAQTLSRALLPNGRKITHQTPSPLLTTTTYETTRDAAGVLQHTTVFPDGTSVLKKSHPSGLEFEIARDKTVTETTMVLDKSFSASRLRPSKTTIKLPSAPANTVSSTRWSAVCTPSGSTTKTQISATAVGTTELKCDPANQSVLAPSPPPHTKTVRTYSATGQTLTTTSPANRVVTKTFDAAGRPLSSQVGNLTPIVSTYFSSGEFSGKLQTLTQGTRVLAAPEYQPKGAGTPPADAGFVKQVTDALSQKTGFTRDLFGRVKSQIDGKDSALAATSAFGWDANGNLNLVTPPAKPSHGLTYNLFGGLTTYTPPDVPGLTGAAKTTSYTFTNDRAPWQDTLPGNAQITRSYIAGTGQLDTVSFPGGVIDYEYFPSTHATAPGNVQHIKGPYGVDLELTHDGPLLTSMKWSGGVSGTVAFAYDAQTFKVTSETVAGVPVYFGYDKDNLVTCASATSCSPASADALTIVRSPQHGQVTSLTLGNVTETIEYSDTASDLPNNAFGEVRKRTVKYGDTVIAEFEYDAPDRRRDNLGRIRFKKETLLNPSTMINDVVETEYGYDALNRLKSVKIGTAAASTTEYDGNGNVLTSTSPTGTITTRTVDDQDRLLSTSSGYSFAYGPNGEVSTKSVGSLTYTLTYDALGNLTKYKYPVGTVRVDYVTDGMGRRVARTYNGSTQRWLYRDGLNPIAEVDAMGTVVSRFVYASRPNIPDFVIRGGKTYRIIADHLGSPRLVVNVNDMNDVNGIPYRANYTATGVATAVASKPLDWLPFGFAGGMFDKQTNLVRFGARDYDPAVGRWLSKDPIRFDAAGTNFYAYALNDPVNVVDRDGRNPLVLLGLCAFGGCEAVAAAAAAAAATTVAAIACIASGACGEVAEKIADKIDDACTPRTPTPPDDCAQKCLPYMGPGGAYPGSDGHIYRNDLGGQWAFQRCVAECRKKTIN